MLRRYTQAQAAEKLGLDDSEIRFLLLHFREFLFTGPASEAPVSLTDQDLQLMHRVFNLVRHDKFDPADIRSILRAEVTGGRLSGGCQGGILAFGSGRPGSGKSAVLFNLAYSLAARGYRSTIFDGSIGTGGIGQALVSAGRITADCGWNCELEQGIRLMLGQTLVEELGEESITPFPAEIEQTLREIDSSSDFLLLDTGHGRSDNALRYAMVSDEIIEVTTPDVGSNADCFAVIRMLKDVDPDARISLIINRATGLNEAREAFARMNGAARKIGLSELGSVGWIAEDEALRRYMSEGTAVVEALPTSASSRCIGRLADHLAHRLSPVARRTAGTQALVQALRLSLERSRSHLKSEVSL